MFFALGAQAQDDKWTTIAFTSSLQCDMCVKAVEEGLIYEKGVRHVKADVKSNSITVEYRTDKTNEETLAARINAIGYDANDKKAPKERVAKLPVCCQPAAGECHH